jgi:saccharopine dehydrogenase-like NADP-dependent oxidoreductase
MRQPNCADFNFLFVQVDSLIKQSHTVISLLPATMHTPIAQSCVHHRTHLVTASYISPEFRALDRQAREAGIVLLGEMGLDPGMDHMSAMKMIDHITVRGGKVRGFLSVCGGLPAPEAANNPLGYKFRFVSPGFLV